MTIFCTFCIDDSVGACGRDGLGLVTVVSLGVVDDRGLVIVLFASHAGRDPQN